MTAIVPTNRDRDAVASLLRERVRHGVLLHSMSLWFGVLLVALLATLAKRVQRVFRESRAARAKPVLPARLADLLAQQAKLALQEQDPLAVLALLEKQAQLDLLVVLKA